MAEDSVKRKLTAILCADVKGYSRMMGEDEVGTFHTLSDYLEKMNTIIKTHRGRVFSSPGDAILAQFRSVVDAVECAVEIQEKIETKNADVPEDRKMRFRIGVNLGDVIEKEDQIYGDGVNIAARIETLAGAGGISISRTVYNHVYNKLNFGYEYQGEHPVKNIAKPVRVYKVLTAPEHAGQLVGETKTPRFLSKKPSIAILAIIAIVVASVIWRFYPRAPEIEPASVEKMAFPLPDKPSIAVLPFDNMSDDLKEDYFSDGLTEQIISSLSKIQRLFVIARNSTFVYKGKPVKIQKVAEDLGVRYVLEGSVQKSGDRVRITAQLIDAITGRHVWSERYDRELKDIFALQDEIAIKVMNGMGAELTEGEQARLWTKRGPDNLKALEKHYQALSYFCLQTKEDHDMARPLFEEAIALDPKFVWPYVYKGYIHILAVLYGRSESPAKSLQMALELAQKALAIDDLNSGVHSLLALIYITKRQYDKALSEAERAVALNPNAADAYLILGASLGYLGRWEENISFAKKSIRLSPFPGVSYYVSLGRAYFMTGQYDESIVTWKKALQVSPNYLKAHIYLAACYSSMGRDAEAAAAAKEVLNSNPKFSTDSFAKRLPFKNEADIERLLAAMRKAGLPDKPPLPLPDKPSIAVLAFDNMSGDPEQEYFSDGLAEDIITALSKVPELFVIARNSSFAYKGKPVKIQQIGRDMGVRYVLEGSVRKAEDRVRITAQLIDAKTGNHLWAERYDRALEDIFALQDEITKNILTSLQVKLTEGERIRVWSRSTDNLNAFQKFLKARVHYLRFNPDDNAIARQLYEEAIALDPEFTSAILDLAWTHIIDVWFGLSKSPKESWEQATQLTHRAISLDKSQASAYVTLGTISQSKGQFKEAIALGEKAVALSPGDSLQIAMLSSFLKDAGRYEEALSLIKKAIRLDPIPLPWYLNIAGGCYLRLERYEEAIEEYKKILHRNQNNLFARINITAAYSLLGREEEASASASEVLRINPKFRIKTYAKSHVEKNKEDKDRYINALRMAGLPE